MLEKVVTRRVLTQEEPMPNIAAPEALLETAARRFQASASRQPRDRWIRVRVTEQERSSMRQCAEAFGTTVSALVRQLVEHAGHQRSGRRGR